MLVGLVAASMGCVESSDGEDEFEREDSSVTEEEGRHGDTRPVEEVEELEEVEEVRVAGVQFNLFRLWDEQTILIVNRALEDEPMPFDFADFLPVAPGSQHFYLIPTIALPRSSYDVEARAIDEQGEIIEECQEAIARGRRGEASGELEFLMPIQCDDSVGIATGVEGIDEVLFFTGETFKVESVLFPAPIINFAPRIESMEVGPSAYETCPETVELCATVVEPDWDPVDFQWLQLEGPRALAGPTEVRRTQDEGETEQCVAYELPEEDGDYVFELQVFDQLLEDDRPISFEAWYQREDYGDIASQDRDTVGFSVRCPEEDKGDKSDKSDTGYEAQRATIHAWLAELDDDEQRDELTDVVDGLDDGEQLDTIAEAIINQKDEEAVIAKIMGG